MTRPKFDVYQTITDEILAALEAGAKPWVNSWKGQGGGGLPLRHNGEPYQGINVLVLWCAAQRRGFTSPYWMTFKQAKELGAHVRKGERSTVVMYYGAGVRENTETGEEEGFSFAKAYRVFNAEQIDGLGEAFGAPGAIDTGARAIGAVERYFGRIGAKVETRRGTPCYVPAMDTIRMPPVHEFASADAFYSVLAHEHVHNAEVRIMLRRSSLTAAQWEDQRGVSA